MPNENDLLKIFDRLQDSRFLRTKKGLVFVFLLIIVTFSCTIKPFANPQYNVFFSLGVSFFYVIFWLFYSGRLFFPSKITIMFAIEQGEKSEKYFSQIKRTIKSEFDRLNLAKSIKVIYMPSDFVIQERNYAEKYSKRKMVDLLIWGHSIEARLPSSDLAEFDLKFTYSYRTLPEQIRENFVKQIAASMRGRYWKILDENSFTDIHVVSANITEVSLFILALCLYVRGELESSINIFEKLKPLLDTKNDASFPNLSVIKKQVDSYLIEGYRFLGIQLADKKPLKSKSYFEKILCMRPDDSGAHLCMAKLSYLTSNDLGLAIDHTDKVTDSDLKPIANYNYAFFGILKKDPSMVLKYYQRIRATPSQNIIDIIAFLESEFLKNSDNILFHFAIGYINMYHGDARVGIKELKKFVTKAKGVPEYSNLVENVTLDPLP